MLYGGTISIYGDAARQPGVAPLSPGQLATDSADVLGGQGRVHECSAGDALMRSSPNRGLAVNSAGLMVLQGVGFALWGGIGQAIGLRQAIVVAGCCGLLVVTLLAPRVLRDFQLTNPACVHGGEPATPTR